MLIDQISEDLQISTGELWQIAKSANHLYRRVEIPKRNKGTRYVFVPTPELKLLQRWLVGNYISRLRLHDCAMAYRRGRCIRGNAEAHSKARYLLRIDLSRFFPSISVSDIAELFEREESLFESWTVDDKKFFLRIVCRKERLLIGAPSSPALSNAVCVELDEVIAALARTRAVNYTRYADDLFFSTNVPDTLRRVETDVSRFIATASWPKNLRVNRSKTVHASRKRRRRVTGVTITPQGTLSLGRERKRMISAMVHQVESLSKEARLALPGHLSHAHSIEPAFRSRLERKYGEDVVLRAMKNT